MKEFNLKFQIEMFDNTLAAGVIYVTADTEETAKKLAFVGLLKSRKDDYEMDGDDDYLGNIKSVTLNLEEA